MGQAARSGGVRISFGEWRRRREVARGGAALRRTRRRGAGRGCRLVKLAAPRGLGKALSRVVQCASAWQRYSLYTPLKQPATLGRQRWRVVVLPVPVCWRSSTPVCDRPVGGLLTANACWAGPRPAIVQASHCVVAALKQGRGCVKRVGAKHMVLPPSLEHLACLGPLFLGARRQRLKDGLQHPLYASHCSARRQDTALCVSGRAGEEGDGGTGRAHRTCLCPWPLTLQQSPR